jgi:hypothetical protein
MKLRLGMGWLFGGYAFPFFFLARNESKTKAAGIWLFKYQ